MPYMTDIAETFVPRATYSKSDLIASGHGQLLGSGKAQLPLPPMLMMDRITEVTMDGGTFGKGNVIGELDIHPGLWFFACHFEGDPVMPGCLGLDAVWQAVGFWLSWSGSHGKGRAIGVGEVKLTGQIVPETRLVRYEINIKRVKRGKLVLGIADALVQADGRTVYTMEDLKVGLFTPDQGV
jgi:3-hydroxyacyl-[acyl-carrier protein] dehydratase/trans-2-decenoyl-[acyl-carrier protein] isomerase